MRFGEKNAGFYQYALTDMDNGDTVLLSPNPFAGYKMWSNFLGAVIISDVDSSQWKVQLVGDFGPYADVILAETDTITATGTFQIKNRTLSTTLPTPHYIKVIRTSGAGTAMVGVASLGAKGFRGRGVTKRGGDSVSEGFMDGVEALDSGDMPATRVLVQGGSGPRMNGLDHFNIWTDFVAVVNPYTVTGTGLDIDFQIRGDLPGVTDVILAEKTGVGAVGKYIFEMKTYGVMVAPKDILITDNSTTLTDLDYSIYFLARSHPGQRNGFIGR